MYSFSQSTGAITRDGVLMGTGHAGNGDGRNNPAWQCAHNVGPLPRGKYRIGTWEANHGHLGPIVAPLIPQPDETGSYEWLCGRGGFYIHAPEFSEGCIALPHDVRLAMSLSGDSQLEVVA